MGDRRWSRELALQGLYMHEVAQVPIDQVLKFTWDMADLDDEEAEEVSRKRLINLESLDDEEREKITSFARQIITGTLDKLQEIDDIIISYSKNWDLARIDAIDKTILRFSIYSLLHLDDVPSAVTIDEAIELAKEYGGENSGQFINGILDAVKTTHISK